MINYYTGNLSLTRNRLLCKIICGKFVLRIVMSPHSNYTDHELLALLREGDRDAYTEIYNRYNGPLYVFVYKRIGDREETRDLLHELFLSVWVNHSVLNITTGLAPYLYTAAKNKIIKLAAKEKTSARYIESFRSYLETASETTDHLVRHNEMSAFIENEITKLPARMKLVFELSRKTNMTRKQIAEALDISEETVKSQMHGALKTLKVKLGPMFYLLF